METKYLKIGLISFVCIVFIFLLVKFLLLKESPQPPPPPPVEILSPEEVAIKYLELQQEKNRQEAEKYLFSDFSKVEIFRDNYQELRGFSYGVRLEEKSASLPGFKIITAEVGENEANIVLEEITNRVEGTNFFKFFLPPKLVFEVNLVKEGEDWKIIKIDSPDLVLERRLGEIVEIRENIFAKPVKISGYQPKDINVKPRAGFKFLSFLAEYENRSTDTITLTPPSGWTLIDENKNIYDSFRHLTVQREIKEVATPPEIKLKPNETEDVYFFFQVPKETQIQELVFKNLNKKVIFKID